MKIELLIIDPQNDFCDPNNGSLYVNGADKDMKRLSDMIVRLSTKISDIHITLDSHHPRDISHSLFWTNSEGKNPDPFTMITIEDLENGVWKPICQPLFNRVYQYLKELKKSNRYSLIIWPEHCLIGEPGSNIYPEISKAVRFWILEKFRIGDYVTKGSNVMTEHYSAVKAEVPDPIDPTTQLNFPLIETLQKADEILISGEALSHCLKFTVEDIADNFGEENIKKLVLLEDATSSVTGFEQNGKDFIDNMTKRGMKISTTDKYMI